MQESSARSLILEVLPAAGRLPGIDPFIFGAYHQDRYPRGNGRLGPDAALLNGRDIGMDFSRKDGWSMYHGEVVPGFPAHPHRGFETVTIVRQGLVDHADSLGATARYGQGDVQWLTTGRGAEHSEMFPLVDEREGNTLDLFQLWLNLPAKSKMVQPGFKIFWGPTIPVVRHRDAQGRDSAVEVIAGAYTPVDAASVADGATPATPPSPPQHSWASEPGTDVAIWIVRLQPGAQLTLPAASPLARRALYLTTGTALSIGDSRFDEPVMVEVVADRPAPLRNDSDAVIEVLLLQGRPIGEPVVARGPIVMNTEAEVRQAVMDFQRGGFGAWPWPTRSSTFGSEPRFARYQDGRVEHPPG